MSNRTSRIAERQAEAEKREAERLSERRRRSLVKLLASAVKIAKRMTDYTMRYDVAAWLRPGFLYLTDGHLAARLKVPEFDTKDEGTQTRALGAVPAKKSMLITVADELAITTPLITATPLVDEKRHPNLTTLLQDHLSRPPAAIRITVTLATLRDALELATLQGWSSANLTITEPTAGELERDKDAIGKLMMVETGGERLSWNTREGKKFGWAAGETQPDVIVCAGMRYVVMQHPERPEDVNLEPEEDHAQ